MHVYVDDSGCGGFKLGHGSSSHLVMSAAVFRDTAEIQRLDDLLESDRHPRAPKCEFKFTKSNDARRARFFEVVDPVDFHVRAIVIDKTLVRSGHLRSNPAAFKSWAIRMLLTKHFGQIQNAKIFIDGKDTRGFGVSDEAYLMRMVNREAPGTIGAVRFVDSKQSIGIQLADMTAGAINRAYCNEPRRDGTYLRAFRRKTYQPRGSLWLFK